MLLQNDYYNFCEVNHGLRTPREEIAFTTRPKIHSHSQILGTAKAYFVCHIGPNFSDIFDLCLHWVSVVREVNHRELKLDLYG